MNPEFEKDASEKTEGNEEKFVVLREARITGLKIAYYNICITKLWLFSHQIQFEDRNIYVQIGKEIQKDRYGREKKDVMVDETICVDFIGKKKNEDGKIVIHEIKKSKSMNTSHHLQVKYYIYYLKMKGIEATGLINYPLLNKTEKIELTSEDVEEMESKVKDIKKIISGKMPSPERKKICPPCAYYEFCFGD